MVKPKVQIVLRAFILIVLLCWLVPIFWKVKELKEQKAQLEEEIRQYSTRNRVLEHKLRLLEEDPTYIEKVARKKFRKAKEGEVVYQMVAPGEIE